MSDDRLSCEQCRYYDPKTPNIAGRCRRRAPAPLREGQATYAVWPIVTVGDWCGEWRPAGDDA